MAKIKHFSRASQLPGKTRVALYGAGSAGCTLRAFLAEERSDITVVLFVDAHKTDPVEGLSVIRPDEIKARSHEFDVLIVASGFALEIGAELERQQIDEYWICDRHLLEYAHYCMSEQRGGDVDVTRQRSYAEPGSHVRVINGKPINFLPESRDLNAADGIERFILAGYLPEVPFISKRTRVTAFGSCFAGHIRKHLVAHGYSLTGEVFDAHKESPDRESYRYYDKAYVFYRHSDFDNSFVAREQFEWALEGREFKDKLWYDAHQQPCSRDDQARDATRRLFLETDVFVFTLGLAEVWQNIETNEVIWGRIPKEDIDSDVHQFRLTTVAENVENIERIYALVRKHMPKTRIILTLSPVPLKGTWRDISCLSANSVSKATLRVAIDEVWRRHRDEGFLYYWPSYEIVKDATIKPFKADNRHVREDVVAEMMERFSRYYLTDESQPVREQIRRRPMIAPSLGPAAAV